MSGSLLSGYLTEYMDVAQVVLYLFWGFFFALIFWLRREDRREGYPLENDNPRAILPATRLMIPLPKTFILEHGATVQAPNFRRDPATVPATRSANASGATLVPDGDPLLSGLGPASYANRRDEVELSSEGHQLVVPLRAAKAFTISAGPDPRGWEVVGADGRPGGKVTDIWLDTADAEVRFIEYELTGGTKGVRLVPLPMALLKARTSQVEVASIRAGQFESVPTTKESESITVLEEEKISAFYAGGRLYADPSRVRPLL